MTLTRSASAAAEAAAAAAANESAALLDDLTDLAIEGGSSAGTLHYHRYMHMPTTRTRRRRSGGRD